ncbi:cAMP-binding domain of CRP or a regulatory subunit of cAMP-dependent protein kinases [Flaviramulus basaltis]|uniref:cAMP-binding domain of CRP or a regulatory subunit of cAMP-dependent protein kinases n=1 Tax=Flaviramulus basaltis TaxID=369401 RepID=A0A1K2II55_9FLAO|nr:Crp/Fnr family transcriptional regulator [Flaviramulus basaltis]SFZ91920.1 cAMP-binding domain of CRP or a regulatory subunit of cAMP-dependent protein kinases [Flaviramulus basaltis]
MKSQPLLNYIKNFVTLTVEEEAFLESKVLYRKYLKGQYVLQQGDVCKYQCFVISGCTKTFHSDDQGQEHIVMFSIQDWWTSDIGSFITQTPADYNIQCIDKTELIMFSHDVMEELYIEIPKLERFFRKIIERGLVASQKRIVRSFSLSAKDRYLYFRNQYPKIEQLIPQYMLASYLGITKEFLSKIKSQLLLEDQS